MYSLEIIEDDDIDLEGVFLSHYRLSKIREQDMKRKEDEPEYLAPRDDLGSAKAKDKKEEFISRIIYKLNEVFIEDNLTDDEKIMLGGFPGAVEYAVMDSGEVHS